MLVYLKGMLRILLIAVRLVHPGARAVEMGKWHTHLTNKL